MKSGYHLVYYGTWWSAGGLLLPKRQGRCAPGIKLFDGHAGNSRRALGAKTCGSKAPLLERDSTGRNRIACFTDRFVPETQSAG